MLRGRSRRITAVITLSIGLTTVAVAVAAVGGTYSGSSGNRFTITIQASKAKVSSVTLSCDRGAVTVQSSGRSSKIAGNKFTYSGPERSSLSTRKTLKMKITGTFSRSGRMVRGTAASDSQCKRGSYSATR